jgi:hypothetical protein
MSAADLLSMATARRFRPSWKPLPQMLEANVFGLGLDVKECQVPLMAKMERVVSVEPVVSSTTEQLQVDDRQMSLFN